MAVKRIVVHCIEVEDRPGGLHKLLARAAEANVDLLCFAAFSTGSGQGRVYLCAKDPASLEACAKQAGIEAAEAAGFVIDAEDKVGAAAAALKVLADANINGVAGAAMVCNGQYRMLVVVDATDGSAAASALGA
ncbi:MAG: ACT domain-containing protein [Planctomycetota bacterium]|jgi:hypothetical protein